MAVTLTDLQVIIRLVGTLNGGADLSALTDTLNKNYTTTYFNGTGANQANMWWHDQRTLSASANESLDLAGGLTSLFGPALTFTAIKAVIVMASTGNTNDVQVTRPANGVGLFMASGDGIALGPGDVFAWSSPSAAGKAVTGGTGDLLNIANSGGGTPVTYDIFVLGEV